MDYSSPNNNQIKADGITYSDNSLLTNITSLVFDNNNNLYAYQCKSLEILKINIKKEVTVLTNFINFNDVYNGSIRNMVLVNNLLYVTGYKNSIYTVDINTGKTDILSLTNLNNKVSSILYYYDKKNNTGYLYFISDYNGGSIYRINMNIMQIDDTFSIEYKLKYPIHIIIDNYEHLYIVDKDNDNNNILLKFTINGNFIAKHINNGLFELENPLCYNDYFYFTYFQELGGKLKSVVVQYDINGRLNNSSFAIGNEITANVFDNNNNYYFNNIIKESFYKEKSSIRILSLNKLSFKILYIIIFIIIIAYLYNMH